jgi:hypothetical protein
MSNQGASLSFRRTGGWPTLSCSRVFPGLTIMPRDDTTLPVLLRVHQRGRVPHPCRRQGWGLFGFVRCRRSLSGATMAKATSPPLQFEGWGTLRRGLGRARVSELCRCDARSQARIGVSRMGHPPDLQVRFRDSEDRNSTYRGHWESCHTRLRGRILPRLTSNQFAISVYCGNDTDRQN